MGLCPWGEWCGQGAMVRKGVERCSMIRYVTCGVVWAGVDGEMRRGGGMGEPQ